MSGPNASGNRWAMSNNLRQIPDGAKVSLTQSRLWSCFRSEMNVLTLLQSAAAQAAHQGCASIPGHRLCPGGPPQAPGAGRVICAGGRPPQA